MKLGVVYWITGLSGSGKTTIAKELDFILKQNGERFVFLDGDELRNILGLSNSAYLPMERLELAKKYSKFCKLISEQGIGVICATVSMFDEVRDWNRKNIKNYIEIYLDVSQEILLKRDKKNLYTNSMSNKINNVVGVDLKVEEPKDPDLVINNDGEQSPFEIARQIFDFSMLSSEVFCSGN